MVEKYGPISTEHGYAGMGPSSIGGFVRHSDYAALDQKFMILQGSHDLLVKERDELKRRCDRFEAALRRHGDSSRFIHYSGGWRMTYAEQVLEDLEKCDFLRYDDKRVVGRRLPILQQLEAGGKITMRLVEVDDQESYLEVRLAEKKR